jgi:monoamine oxidase
MTVTRETIPKPVGPIGWAGAERSELWEGQMDGAIHSGERAATERAAALTCAETASV